MHAVHLNPAPTLTVSGSSQRFPVARVFCIGRNYAAHSREMGGNPEREAPFFFMKPSTAILCAPQQLPIPLHHGAVHHEVELAVAIGKPFNSQAPADGIFGYAVAIDLTLRDLQNVAKAARRPWEAAKAFDGSAPIGCLTTAEQWQPLPGYAIKLDLDNKTVQHGELGQMIWGVPELLASINRYIKLQAGDIVLTGTPSGVGSLTVGQQLVASISGLPELNCQIANELKIGEP